MEEGEFGWQVPEKIQMIKTDGMARVIVDGKPYMNWVEGDEVAKRMAIVQLYELGLVTQEELAKIFRLHVNSITKYVTTFKVDGASGLISQPRGPKESWKLTSKVRAKILFLVLNEKIREYGLIQKRLEDWNIRLSIESIRQVLQENGLVRESISAPKIEQRDLFEEISRGQLEISFSDREGIEGQINEVTIKESEKAKGHNFADTESVGSENKDRSYYSQSQWRYLGQIEQGEYSVYAGGLLFVSLLEQYNFLATIRRIINIETHEGYSLDEICLTLFYFDLFRFQSMEDFKTVYPEEYSVLIGRESIPSVCTLRRFLHKVKGLGKSEELIEEFAKEYLRRGIAKWGVLYIDSHFLAYYGVYTISMGWHGVRKIPMKGSYNFIAIDEKFNPLLFLVRSSSEDLLQKIPEIIIKARKLAKETSGDCFANARNDTSLGHCEE